MINFVRFEFAELADFAVRVEENVSIFSQKNEKDVSVIKLFILETIYGSMW
jgi:hypothetical protein